MHYLGKQNRGNCGSYMGFKIDGNSYIHIIEVNLLLFNTFPAPSISLS